MTEQSLEELHRTELAQIAKERGILVLEWRELRKVELAEALSGKPMSAVEARRRLRPNLVVLEDRIIPSNVIVTGLSPTFGPVGRGTIVTISGTGFTGVIAVDFHPTNSAKDFVDATSTKRFPYIVAESTQAGDGGAVVVTVTASVEMSDTSSADVFTYAPMVTGLSPTFGPAAGCTFVTIAGIGFTGATAVDFGTNPATNSTLVSAAAISPSPSDRENSASMKSVEISNIAISDRTYPLRKPCRAFYTAKSSDAVEYVVERFEPLFIGRGANASLAEADWIEQVHSAFQHLYRKIPPEMTPTEVAQWSLFEQAIDIEAYNRLTPRVLRHLGMVSKVRHAPCEVAWLDGTKEEVGVAMCPSEFAGFSLGQWFDALVERDAGTWAIRRILNVVPVEAPTQMPRERLKKFWESLPTTAALPKSSRDWASAK